MGSSLWKEQFAVTMFAIVYGHPLMVSEKLVLIHETGDEHDTRALAGFLCQPTLGFILYSLKSWTAVTCLFLHSPFLTVMMIFVCMCGKYYMSVFYKYTYIYFMFLKNEGRRGATQQHSTVHQLLLVLKACWLKLCHVLSIIPNDL